MFTFKSWKVYQSVLAAITKYHRLGGLNNRFLFYHSSGGWKSFVKVPAGFVSDESPLPGYPSHCVLTWPFLCVNAEKRLW